MLEYLKLNNVGPAQEMKMEFTPRMNIITGDNGLGKSFLLDVAWWSLTRKWPHDLNPSLTSGYPARPTDPKKQATIEFRLTSKVKSVNYVSQYSPRNEAWVRKPGRPWNPGLIIYAHADGGFSVWDPARNYWLGNKSDIDIPERLPAYVFSVNEVWDGLEVVMDGKKAIVSNGLLRDWAGWIKENGENARRMAAILAKIAPTGELLGPGPLVRLSVNDARDIPSIKTAYTDQVPILHASAGIRRMIGLVYMLLWSWNEHTLAAKNLGEEQTSKVVILFDEIESHLHPRWQRLILKSVLDITKMLHEEATIQLIAATHSPLILASAEPTFDSTKDAWFDIDFDQTDRTVKLAKKEFIRRGTAGRWLTSQAFDLASQGRSIEAEQAIAAAEALLGRRRDGDILKQEEIDLVDQGLRQTLPDVDRFWLRWSAQIGELRSST